MKSVLVTFFSVSLFAGCASTPSKMDELRIPASASKHRKPEVTGSSCLNKNFLGQWEVISEQDRGTTLYIADPQELDWQWYKDKINTDTLGTPNGLFFYRKKLSGPSALKGQDLGDVFNVAPRGNSCGLAVKPAGTIEAPYKSGTISYDASRDQITLKDFFSFSGTLKRSSVEDPDVEISKHLVVSYVDHSGLTWGTLRDYQPNGEDQPKLDREIAKSLCKAKGARLPSIEEFKQLASELGSSPLDLKESGYNHLKDNYSNHIEVFFGVRSQDEQLVDVLFKNNCRFVPMGASPWRYECNPRHYGFGPFFLDDKGLVTAGSIDKTEQVVIVIAESEPEVVDSNPGLNVMERSHAEQVMCVKHD